MVCRKDRERVGGSYRFKIKDTVSKAYEEGSDCLRGRAVRRDLNKPLGGSALGDRESDVFKGVGEVLVYYLAVTRAVPCVCLYQVAVVKHYLTVFEGVGGVEDGCVTRAAPALGAGRKQYL